MALVISPLISSTFLSLSLALGIGIAESKDFV